MSPKKREAEKSGRQGGKAGGGGYEFQERAAAYVVAHMLSRAPLRWIDGPDVPVAVAAETGGPGDDWCVELESGWRIEIQCKRGLKRGKRLWKALRDLAEGLAKGIADGDDLAGVLLVDGTSSTTIKHGLSEDLIRVGQGESKKGSLKKITTEFLTLVEQPMMGDNPDPVSICSRLRVITLDLSVGKDAEKVAVAKLQEVVKRDSAQAAWSVLVAQCQALIRTAGRRNTESWFTYLAGEGIPRSTSSEALPVRSEPGLELKRYLGKLEYQVGQLTLDTLDPEGMRDVANRPGLPLDMVYTPLLTMSTKGEQLQDERSPGKLDTMHKRARRLSALEMVNRHDRLVLLGDPGSGKSTFVNFMALCLAREGKGKPGRGLDQLNRLLSEEEDEEGQTQQPWTCGVLIPIRVVLRDFAVRGLPEGREAFTEEQLWKFIETLPECEEQGCVALLREWLGRRGGLVLFDGLDEVPEAEGRREQIQQVVERFAAAYHNCRVVLTTRTNGYRELRGFRKVELAPFTPAQVRYFVDRWRAAVVKAERLDECLARQRCEDLKAAISQNAGLAELAERPLLLTLMAAHHSWSAEKLPEQRGRLYEKAVDLLLDRWPRQKVTQNRERESRGPHSLMAWLKPTVNRLKIRKLLEELAFRAHEVQPVESENAADIQELAEAIRMSRENLGMAQDDLKNYLCERAGILLAQRGVYRFSRRVFQEYLAACYVTSDEKEPDEFVRQLQGEPGRWREVALLAVARTKGYGLRVFLEALCGRKGPRDLPKNDGDVWSTHLAGLALGEREDPQRFFAGSLLMSDVARRIREWLIDNMSGVVLPVRERALGGLVLDRIGDARFAGRLWKLPHELLGFVRIPKGPFLVVRALSDANASDDEKQQIELTLPEYYMGKYCVTVGQFRAYCEIAGVRPGCPGALDGASNLPVAWVTWKEAAGYCNWLTEALRESEATPQELRKLLRREEGANWQVMLPSEAEWEKAARGTDGRRWPWGNDWEAGRANCAEAMMGERAPVGCFSQRNPYGLEEMSGNVWEWTRSLWADDPYLQGAEPRKERELLAGTGDRVVRGGSFAGEPKSVRCASRLRLPPTELRGDVGFRLALCQVSEANLRLSGK